MRTSSETPSRNARPISRHRLPRVAAQASPSVSRRPTAAAAATWEIIPVTRIVPNVLSTVPISSEPTEPATPTTSVSLAPSPKSSEVPTVKLSTAVTTTGITQAIAETSTAEPTVAFGLKRMMRNAASYMSPRVSGRSGIAPGLCAAPSIPGGGAHVPGGGAGGGHWPGGGAAGAWPAYDGGGGGGGCHPGGGGWAPVPGSDMAAILSGGWFSRGRSTRSGAASPWPGPAAGRSRCRRRCCPRRAPRTAARRTHRRRGTPPAA